MKVENEILKLIESYKRENRDRTKALNDCNNQLRYTSLIAQYNLTNQFIEDLELLHIISKAKN